MEGIMRSTKKTRPTRPLSTNSSGTLPMHKDSRTIGKLGKVPKIRIIHIFAPEIIKTDVANFRELVQRLTGKPTAGDQKNNACKLPGSTLVMKKSMPRKVDQDPVVAAAAAVAVAKRSTSSLSRIKDDEEEEMWGGGGLEEYYGLMQDTHYNINGFLHHPPLIDDLHSFEC